MSGLLIADRVIAAGANRSRRKDCLNYEITIQSLLYTLDRRSLCSVYPWRRVLQQTGGENEKK
jgi:hypothetical protein